MATPKDPKALYEWMRWYYRQDEIEVPAEPKVDEPRPCPVPIRPGQQNARAAYKAGCEDEWCDRMKSRYGGEW